MGLAPPGAPPWTEEQLVALMRHNHQRILVQVALERLQAKQGGAAPGLATAAGSGKLRGMVRTAMTTTPTKPRRRESLRQGGHRLIIRMSADDLGAIHSAAAAKGTTASALTRAALAAMGVPISP